MISILLYYFYYNKSFNISRITSFVDTIKRLALLLYSRLIYLNELEITVLLLGRYSYSSNEIISIRGISLEYAIALSLNFTLLIFFNLI